MNYLKLSYGFLADAKEALAEYRDTRDEEKLRQACEKAFGAFAQALMHYKGRDLHHREFRDVVEELFLKTKSYGIVEAHTYAESLHASFYHGLLSHIEVEYALSRIETGIQDVAQLKV